MKKIWNNYNEIIKLAKENGVRGCLLENYDSLKRESHSLKQIVQEIKEELILILSKKDYGNTRIRRDQ